MPFRRRNREYPLQVEDELLSILTTGDGGEILFVGTPAGRPITYYQLEILPVTPDAAELVWRVASDCGFVIGRWNSAPDWYLSEQPGKPSRFRLEPPLAAVACSTAVVEMQLPKRWPLPVVLTSPTDLLDFLATPA
jgi:hypothetical protein